MMFPEQCKSMLRRLRIHLVPSCIGIKTPTSPSAYRQIQWHVCVWTKLKAGSATFPKIQKNTSKF